ncbi:MAG TPA: hypothetical protein VGC47_00490 [Acidimicrobiia bacterium]
MAATVWIEHVVGFLVRHQIAQVGDRLRLPRICARESGQGVGDQRLRRLEPGRIVEIGMVDAKPHEEVAQARLLHDAEHPTITAREPGGRLADICHLHAGHAIQLGARHEVVRYARDDQHRQTLDWPLAQIRCPYASLTPAHGEQTAEARERLVHLVESEQRAGIDGRDLRAGPGFRLRRDLFHWCGLERCRGGKSRRRLVVPATRE